MYDFEPTKKSISNLLSSASHETFRRHVGNDNEDFGSDENVRTFDLGTKGFVIGPFVEVLYMLIDEFDLCFVKNNGILTIVIVPPGGFIFVVMTRVHGVTAPTLADTLVAPHEQTAHIGKMWRWVADEIGRTDHLFVLADEQPWIKIVCVLEAVMENHVGHNLHCVGTIDRVADRQNHVATLATVRAVLLGIAPGDLQVAAREQLPGHGSWILNVKVPLVMNTTRCRSSLPPDDGVLELGERADSLESPLLAFIVRENPSTRLASHEFSEYSTIYQLK